MLNALSANFDLNTDASMQETIRKELAKCTIISATHRLSNIADFERIAVLRNEKIVDIGSQVILLNRREGHGAFKELCELRRSTWFDLASLGTTMRGPCNPAA